MANVCRLIGWLIMSASLTLGAAEPKKDAPANRLAKESSPYLLQHAHNPVDWYPWGPEAFEKARKEKKLIFLSVGYSSCHWCHVMERESFEDAGVAEIMNKNFVCVKVDREERPDVDEIYMTSLQVLGARGGWPMSMFLTDTGKPIVGGTYWPKEDRVIDGDTIRGFKTVLKVVNDLHADPEKNKQLMDQADTIAEQVSEALGRASRGNPLVELNKALAMGSAETIRENIDPEHGGIGNASRKHRGTKFPMPPSLFTLMRHAHREKDKELKALVDLTLDKMAKGGIYDQIGGGFHRYSTERTWTVPHFEKMLYDNGQLVELYSEAYQLDPKPIYQRIAKETIAFLEREMTSPEGGFYSALDADSNGVEGEFYVWTPEEIEKALGNKEDALFIRAVYSMSGSPNFEDKSYILRITRPFEEIAKDQKLTVAELETKLAGLTPKLLAAREKRHRPFLDTKMLTAWNGQMISGLALAGQVFKEPKYTQMATKAANFLLKTGRNKDGRLLRTISKKADGTTEAKLNAYLEDYAYLTHGLLRLHDATGDERWLKEAKNLADQTIQWFGEKDKGGYFYTSSDHEKLFARPKDYHDGVQPSGNSVMAANMLDLAKKTGEAKYRTEAERTIKQFAGLLKGNPGGVPTLAETLHQFLGQTVSTEPLLQPKPKGGGLKTSSDMVAAKVVPVKDKPDEYVVNLTVTKDWHIYANPVENDTLGPSQTVAEVWQDGKKLSSTATYPEGTIVKEKLGDYRVYRGEVAVHVKLKTPPTGESLEIRVKVAACSEGEDARCLQPSTIVLPVK
ncbi:DUF255 domain-containing protein [Zavarzinella formosa]|uniref:DUF255 domain-containing protein n=1 Tax=Zavarzinella formosa TaxID=360055 RepID=UPI00030F4E07|nr:DUF255 domain-containing protein [Zavarzinella formosa]